MTDHDKKISGVEAPMNPVQQQSAPSEGRRRLMKGALAAPAVMTLMHGRLAAAMSATCAERNGLFDGIEIGRLEDVQGENTTLTTYVISSGEVQKTVSLNQQQESQKLISYDQAVSELGNDLNPAFGGVGGSCLASFPV